MKKGGRVKYFIIPLAGGISLAILILALSLSLQVDIEPAVFKYVNVSGGPGVGDYDFFFVLVDANQTNGPSNGYVDLKIYDSNSTRLYQSYTLVRSFNFSTFTNYTGGIPVVGYHWTVPLADVAPGIPFPGGLGRVELNFLALSGRYISATLEIPIPVKEA